MIAGVVLDDECTCVLCMKYCSMYLCEHIIPHVVRVQTSEAVLCMCYFICAIW